MSALEDRQDAAPAIEAPAAVPAPAEAETADLAAMAAEEGGSDTSAQEQAEPAGAAHVAPALQADHDLDETGAAAAAPAAQGLFADDVAPGADAGSDDTPPLLDDTLEAGIASVFAALYSAAGNDEADEADEPEGPLSEDEAVDGITFRLLGELDRLWHRAA